MSGPNKGARRKDGTVVKRIDIRTSTSLVRAVPLRLVNGKYKKGGVDTFTYLIDIDEPARIRVAHADPHECARLAQIELEAALLVTWKDCILVEVEGREREEYFDDSATQARARLNISFSFVQTGVRSGLPVWRAITERPGSPTDTDAFPSKRTPSDYIQTGSPVVEKRPSRGSTETAHGITRRYIEDGPTEALIDDTPFNRQRLQSIIAGLEAMRRKVEDLLSPENIEATLTSGIPLMLESGPVSLPDAPRTIDVTVKKEATKPKKSARSAARGSGRRR